MIPSRACSALLAGLLCLLAACSSEIAPPKTEAPRTVPERQAVTLSGEALFRQFCSSCHPDGGNVSDPGHNLRSETLRNRRITTPEDVVKVMRNPRSRMIRFDNSTLPDREARAIAEYVLTTFK